MSHFTVLVKVNKDRLENHDDNLDSALHEMLLPYQENNMGDAAKKYLSFNDCTAEVENSRTEVIEAGDHLSKEHPKPLAKLSKNSMAASMNLPKNITAIRKTPKPASMAIGKMPMPNGTGIKLAGVGPAFCL